MADPTTALSGAGGSANLLQLLWLLSQGQNGQNPASTSPTPSAPGSTAVPDMPKSIQNAQLVTTPDMLPTDMSANTSGHGTGFYGSTTAIPNPGAGLQYYASQYGGPIGLNGQGGPGAYTFNNGKAGLADWVATPKSVDEGLAAYFNKQNPTPSAPPVAAPLTDAQLGRGAPTAAQTYTPLASTPGTAPVVPSAPAAPVQPVQHPQDAMQAQINASATPLTASTSTDLSQFAAHLAPHLQTYGPTQPAVTMPSQPVQPVPQAQNFQAPQAPSAPISSGISPSQIQNLMAMRQQQQLANPAAASMASGGLAGSVAGATGGAAGGGMLGGGLAGGAMGGGMGAGGMGGAGAGALASGVSGIIQGIGTALQPGKLTMPDLSPVSYPTPQKLYPTIGSQTFMA